MNAEQIEKLKLLHADLDAAVAEFVKFMVEQPIKIECSVDRGLLPALWFACLNGEWGVFFGNGSRPLQKASPADKAVALKNAELLYLELQKQIVVSNTKPSPWSPYRAPGESLLQPPAPTPIRFADLPDDIAFWSAVVLACASTEDVRTIDVALKWADTLLEERRRRFGEVKR